MYWDEYPVMAIDPFKSGNVKNVLETAVPLPDTFFGVTMYVYDVSAFNPVSVQEVSYNVAATTFPSDLDTDRYSYDPSYIN